MNNSTPKLIVISGAHRTGKTSMMTAMADLHPELELLPFSITSCFREFFGDSKRFTMNLPPAIRLEFQKYVLTNWESLAQAGSNTDWIIDRGPLDFATYTLTELTDCTTPKVVDAAMDLVSDCIATHVRTVTHSILVPPTLHKLTGGTPAADPTKVNGTNSLISQRVFTAVLLDLAQTALVVSIKSGMSLVNLEKTSTLPEEVITIQQRVDWLSDFVGLTHEIPK